MGTNPRLGSGHFTWGGQRRTALPLSCSPYVFVGYAPVGAGTPNLVEVHPQLLGHLLGGLGSVWLLLSGNQRAGDVQPNVDIAIRNVLLNLLRQVLSLVSRHGVAFGIPPEPHFRLRFLLEA